MNKFWTIKNKADSDTVELLIYGQIADRSWFGDEATPKQFADDINACNGKDILLRINSPGGDIFAAQAMYNVLKAYKGKVTAHIDGLCASAATVVACGAENVVMPRNALYMIHNPMAVVIDQLDARALTKMAETMDKVKETIVSVYASKAGDKSSEEEIKQLMDDETWMSADDVLAKGLIDEIDDFGVEAQMKAGFMVVNSISMAVKDGEMEKIKNVMHKKKGNGMGYNEFITELKNILGMEPVNKAKVPEPKAKPVEDPKAVAERQRMLAFDKMKAENKNPYIVAAIDACKSMPGMTVEQAKPIVDALMGVKVEPKNDERLQAIAQLINDQMESGAAGVNPVPQLNGKDDKQKKDQAKVADIVARINKIREGK